MLWGPPIQRHTIHTDGRTSRRSNWGLCGQPTNRFLPAKNTHSISVRDTSVPFPTAGDLQSGLISRCPGRRIKGQLFI
jgi:hypothetical protein